MQVEHPAKLASGVLPGLENGSAVTDLRWSPFEPDRLAVGCENGNVHFWTVPDGGVTTLIQTPDVVFEGSTIVFALLKKVHQKVEGILQLVTR